MRNLWGKEKKRWRETWKLQEEGKKKKKKEDEKLRNKKVQQEQAEKDRNRNEFKNPEFKDVRMRVRNACAREKE